jgi:uncharacterized protein with HEPN domain
MLPHDDAIRLRHMLDAGREALGFMAGRSREDLASDTMLQFAVVRAIEVIGEAAAQVSAEGRELVPTVPWPAITAMRNRLIHAYFDINLDRVWETVMLHLPTLVGQLVEALDGGEET